jgi:N-methylhydantoinase A
VAGRFLRPLSGGVLRVREMVKKTGKKAEPDQAKKPNGSKPAEAVPAVAEATSTTSAAGAVRVGIDVGGTFTHAVAIDAATMAIIGRSKVPTTHRAAEGVAKGIIHALAELLAKSRIDPERVSFIAHSTTQATNALLEGDLAPVGVLGMGKGTGSWLAKANTNTKSIELAPKKFLRTFYQFIDTSTELTHEKVRTAIESLVAQGAKAIAISEAFGVDDSHNEEFALEVARSMDLPATSGSEVSKLYGLKVRTRTAVINAAMLPKMIETANMTEKSVRAAGIKAPIMIMRSDGGVMDIDAMRKRPILTMISGPAAGVAAAMMYLNISDGIFLEVGGTSTDISVIRNGKALVKGAEIGGHRVYMRTLDVKTIGVAGGSMFRTSDNSIIDVGPRSAHIAGLGYVSFSPALADPKFHKIEPQPGDPSDYLGISEGDAKPSVCLTPTCAANFLGLVPDGDCAKAPDIERINSVFGKLATHLQSDAKALATAALRLAHKKCLKDIRQFIQDYKLDEHTLTLVGGGGGAAALVPFIASELNVQHALAENADVISAIGVALALVRETVERNIVQPKQEDILRIREEAYAAVQKMGADPASIEIHVEVDTRASIVRATAFGAAGLTKAAERKVLSEEERVNLAASSMRVAKDKVQVLAKTGFFEVFGTETVDRKLFGLLPSRHLSLRALDEKGVIRLQAKNGVVKQTTAGQADKVITDIAEDYATYGDAGKIIPNIMVLTGARIVDLSGLADTGQIIALARTELSSSSADSATIVVASLEH